MDADSSYGGSDTAQDSTLGQDHNSSMETSTSPMQATTMPNHEPPSTAAIDNHYYHKNEVHLNVNYDETDRHQGSRSEDASPRLPHYKSTANLNVNDDERSLKYNSSSHLNGTSMGAKNGQIGLDNPAFQEDEMKSNGSLNLTMTSPSKKDEQMAEAVNLELINLKPNGKDVTGPYENGMKTIPLKREPAGEMPNAYDEYFVPVNEHRKYMSSSRSGKARNSVTFGVNPHDRSDADVNDNVDKASGVDESGMSLTKPEHGVLDYPEWLRAMHQQRGEKLYITKDKRIKTNRNKRICWGIAIAIIAAIIIGGILIGAGVLSEDQPSYAAKESARQFGENRKTAATGNHLETNIIDSQLPYTPGMPTSTLPANIATDTTMIQVPNALESQFIIENMQFQPELAFVGNSEFKELANKLEVLIKDTIAAKNGESVLEVKVVEFTPGVSVRYRIVWRREDDALPQPDVVNEQFVRSKFMQMLKENHGFLDKYRISEQSIVFNRIIDSCKINNNECQDKCVFNYDDFDFQCQCNEGRILSVDGKRCNNLIDEDFNFNEFYSSDHGHQESAPEIAPEPEISAIPEPITDLPSQFQPAVEPEPATKPKSTEIPEFTAVHENPTETEPVAYPEPSAEPEPVTITKLPSKPQPTVEPEPVAEPEPTVEQETELSVKLEPVPSPELPADPEPTSEPESFSKPEVITEAHPLAKVGSEIVSSSPPEPDVASLLTTTEADTVTDAIFEKALKSEVSNESKEAWGGTTAESESAVQQKGETVLNAQPETSVVYSEKEFIDMVETTVQPTWHPETSTKSNIEQTPRKSKFNDGSDEVKSLITTNDTTPGTHPQTNPPESSTTPEPDDDSQFHVLPDDVMADLARETYGMSEQETISPSKSVSQSGLETIAKVDPELTTVASSNIVEDIVTTTKLQESNTVSLEFQASLPENVTIPTESKESAPTMKAIENDTSKPSIVSHLTQVVMGTTTPSNIMNGTTEDASPVMNVEVNINTYHPETHQNIVAFDPTEPPQNHVEAMSPFLPEIENDTLVNILHTGGEIYDHKEDNETTIKPPRLDDDEMHKVNPLDLNVTETTLITTQKTERNRTEETSIMAKTNRSLPLDITNNVHSNYVFDQIAEQFSVSTPSPNSSVEEFSTEDLLAMETTTLDLTLPINDIENTTKIGEMTTINADTILTPLDIIGNNNRDNDLGITTQKPYEVSESSVDITTEPIIILRKGTATESINDLDKLQTEDRDEAFLRVVPLPKSIESSKQEKKRHNNDLDVSDLNAIGDDIQTVVTKYIKGNNLAPSTVTFGTEATTLKYTNNDWNAKKGNEEVDDVKPVSEGFKLEGLSRCETGQFQCINGTSLKDGSYCIPKADRCDSVDDCSDASDENGCAIDGCPGNFQCSNGQCLKRHLVCDGIMNCNDNSDEANCGSWNCVFDEYSCGEGQRCIPLPWRCDGRAHCANGSDERNCHPKECGNNEFHCVDQDVCIPASWLCNGKSDCSSDDDEKSCRECNLEQFKCVTGGGCIDLKLRCDGVSQCADLSDEWNCVSTHNFLQVLTDNRTWIPVCGENWNSAKSDMVCQSMGRARAINTDYIAMSGDRVSEKYYRLKPNGSAENNILAQLEKTDSKCDKVISISCEEYTCGSHSGFDSQEGGNRTFTSQWPSIAFLYNRKQNIKCTASLITPKWAITSHSCIGENFNADYWFLLAGGSQFGIDKQNTTQASQVKAVLAHPQAKYVQFAYVNDVVLIELSTAIELGRNISAICLPEKAMNATQLCVVAGWGVFKPGDTNMPQFLHYLHMPTIEIDECNSTKHYNGHLTEDKICAGFTDSEKSPCYNDEGTPLMCFSESTNTWELQGILSYHANCGRSNHPSIFTSISNQVKAWIVQTIGKSAKD